MDCNKERIRNQYKTTKKDREYTDDNLVIDRCYADIEMEMRNDDGTWEYKIHRVFSNSYHASTALVFDIAEPPEVHPFIFKLRNCEKEAYGLSAKVKYYQPILYGNATNKYRPLYYPNRFTCKHAGQTMEVTITIKDADGRVIQTSKRSLSKLSYDSDLKSSVRRKMQKFYRKNPGKTFETSPDDYKYDFDFTFDKPEGGGSVDVALDTGPLYGVIKSSFKLY
jgi:hypothetical protein